MSTGADQDVIVIGGGIGGMIAANRAAQLGLKATVLEQGDDRYPCNSRYTGGTLHICTRDIMLEEETQRQLIIDYSAGFVRDDLAKVISTHGRRAVRWLQEEGLKFIRASGSEHHKWTLAPPGRVRPGLDWEGRSGDVLLRTLEQQLNKRGGAVVRNTRARSLINEGGKCTGVVAECGGVNKDYRARAVVIADGGFQGNPELVKRYISGHPERLKQRGAGTGRGDGLLMAQAFGAATTGLDRFYGHVLCRDALTNEMLWPYPYLDPLVTAGIVVTVTGQRFVDEGRGGTYTANFIAQLDDPLSAFTIFDHDIWEQPGRFGLIPPNPHLANEGGTMHKAADLAALAKAAGINGVALQATVAAYNKALAEQTEKPLSLTPLRSTKKYKAMPIVKPPFYAVPAVSGITYTMGGIVISAHAQALREDGKAIEGLYVAGAAAGGMEGGPEIAYVGGLSKGGVTGLAAAEHIAEWLGKSPAITH